jgi:prepilin-type N-terminal cleavage/methylation domain-containing protein
LRRSKRQAGFTLIEALVVMMVGVVVLAGAAAGIGKLFRSSEISAEASNITQMAASLRSMKNGSAGYTGLTNAVAVSYRAIPANMAQAADGTITNSWGGGVTITAGSSNQSFSIAYANVPAEACQQLALRLRAAGWTSMSIGTAAINGASTLAEIQAACVSETNTLTFVSGTAPAAAAGASGTTP